MPEAGIQPTSNADLPLIKTHVGETGKAMSHLCLCQWVSLIISSEQMARKLGGEETMLRNLNNNNNLLLAPSLVLNPAFGRTIAMRSELSVWYLLMTVWTDARTE